MHLSFALRLWRNKWCLWTLLYLIVPSHYFLFYDRLFNVFLLILLVYIVRHPWFRCGLKIGIDLVSIHIPIASTLLLKIIRVEVMMPTHQQKCIISISWGWEFCKIIVRYRSLTFRWWVLVCQFYALRSYVRTLVIIFHYALRGFCLRYVFYFGALV